MLARVRIKDVVIDVYDRQLLFDLLQVKVETEKQIQDNTSYATESVTRLSPDIRSSDIQLDDWIKDNPWLSVISKKEQYILESK